MSLPEMTTERAADLFADLVVEEARQERLHGNGSPEAEVVHQAALWTLRLVGLLKREKMAA